MTADRLIENSSTPGDVAGDTLMDNIQEEITGLFDASSLPLTNIAGTKNAITADVVPAITDGLKAGMKFTFKPALNNDDAATLIIGTEPVKTFKTEDGGDLGVSQLVADRLTQIQYDGTNFIVFGTSGITKIADYQVITADGDWNKPANTPDAAKVYLEGWAGGGGGGNGSTVRGGGGGGAGDRKTFRAGDLTSIVACVIGQGGSAGNSGGTTTFGSFLTIFGGGSGHESSNAFTGAGGGAGGDMFGTGNNSGGINGGSADTQAGAGGNGVISGDPETKGSDGDFGGGGGGGVANSGTAGGNSYFGGAGGGSDKSGSSGSGGKSKHGGNGGDGAAAGAIPGGGGGGNASGARGELRIWTNG